MNISCPQARCATLCLVVFLALCITAAASAEGVGEADSARVDAYQANLLTPYEERIVGQRLAYLYEQRHTLSHDADVQARLDRIAARLRTAIPPQALEVKVIQSAKAEAVSFPPGRIYLTSALVRLASTDDELAAVIAHEAAHLSGRHLTRLIALALALPTVERERFPTRRAIVTGQQLQFAFPAGLDEARLRCEMEADNMAVRWLERAGYEGEALPLLLESLAARLKPNVQSERTALQSRVALLRERQFLVLR